MFEFKAGIYKLNHQNCLFFSDLNAYIPLLHKSYTVNQDNSSGIKCSDEFGEHAHQI